LLSPWGFATLALSELYNIYRRDVPQKLQSCNEGNIHTSFRNVAKAASVDDEPETAAGSADLNSAGILVHTNRLDLFKKA
jgi:hypothetical protein